MGTEPGLRSILVKFAKSRGSLTMAQIVHGRNSQSAWMVHHMTHQCNRYARMAASQDIIGWRRFMEGMISYEVVKAQQQYYTFPVIRVILALKIELPGFDFVPDR